MIKTAVLALLLSASLAQGAITRVQSAEIAGNNVTTLTLTFGSNLTPGNVVIVGTGNTGTSQGRLTDNTAYTWTEYPIFGANSVNLAIWIVRITGAGLNTLVFTVGTQQMSLVGAEYSSTNRLMLELQASASGSSTTAASGPTATTAQANELWVGAASTRCTTAGGTDQFTAYQNGFTEVAQTTSTNGTSNTDRSLTLMERFATSTGTANASATCNNNNWAAGVLTFYELASSSGAATTAIPSIQ